MQETPPRRYDRRGLPRFHSRPAAKAGTEKGLQMENKRYRLADSGGLSLAAADADKLISARDGSAALLYLFLLRSGGTP